MKISDWLHPDHVVTGASAATLEEALQTLLEVGARGLGLSPTQVDKLARDLAFGSRGEVVRLHDEMVMVVAEQEGLRGVTGFYLGATRPFQVTAEARETGGTARGAFLVLVPGRPTAFRARVVPQLRRFLAPEGVADTVFAARETGQFFSATGLERLTFQDQTKVAEALQPASYRVFPDTPISELVDLMIRRQLHAVPVVGEDYQVLGIVTTGDALQYLTGRKGASASDEGSARDLMTRAVLCVSEDQELSEIAQLMVNRDVEQLPVVREGALVGFVTRDRVLAVLYGRTVGEDA
jgi:CBS domain-containing protein